VAEGSEPILDREIRIAARPETVFAFFVEAAKLTRWKGIRATLDPRPGGTFRLDINGRDIVSGVYLEVAPNRRIVLSWGWEGATSPLPPGSSTVEISLTAEGPETLVRLRHHGLAFGALYDMHASGWDHYLPRLAIAAAGGEPGADPRATAAQN
jgi:uncharacterized protein YndB with AHSA1/START domain